LIKWDGYSKEQNTWEKEEDVYCKDLIREFEEKIKETANNNNNNNSTSTSTSGNTTSKNTSTNTKNKKKY